MRISDWSSDVCSSDLLTAAFAVERCLVGDDIHRVAHASAIDARAVPDDRDDLALTLFGGITDEFGAALFLDEIEPQFVRRLVARSLPCRPRGAALPEIGRASGRERGCQDV